MRTEANPLGMLDSIAPSESSGVEVDETVEEEALEAPVAVAVAVLLPFVAGAV